ncbi:MULTISPECIES: rhomboid family intramembrane serine protease [unclassified Nocardioides]|uniref:rhomboid family intramembrane serine protease n=1 Tax=unclassified Nocardioides TaxID=2615069 RepID=UPI001E5CCDAE|nr:MULTISPECIES: rhomboid family intramembrane serine protease [unclassified Nocardioides]
MRDAAVGFQCPECVAEGARTTRQARTTYGGVRPGRPGVVSLTLIGINLAVYAAIIVTGWGNSRLLDWLMLRPKGLCFIDRRGGFDISSSQCADVPNGEWLPGVVSGAPWQLLTGAFTHIELWHIGFNMLALYVLGPQLESLLGRWRFLALYLLSALGGSVAVMWLGAEYGAVLGASGAIYGLMGALLVVIRKMGGDASQLMLWIGINVVITLVAAKVSWQGHLGGFVVGAAVAAVLVYAPRGPSRTRVQVSGLVAVTVLILALTAARIAQLA